MRYVNGMVLGMLLLTITAVAWAGSLEADYPPDSPDSAMFTLEDIYIRLDTGAAGTKRSGPFTEPSAGPTAGTGHTLDEVMGKAPAVDDTNGAGVADVANGKTFWGLKSGEWGPRKGTGAIATCPSPVPRTGQTQTLPFNARVGSDGYLQKGVAWPSPRFTANVDNNGDGDCTDDGESCDGTVTDNLTGLIWLKNANCAGIPLPWGQARDVCACLYDGYENWLGTGGDCGLSDGSVAGEWRLPNIKELQSLISFCEWSTALPSGHPFTGMDWFSVWSSWSSSTYQADDSQAWHMHMHDGCVSFGPKDYVEYVWPVRGGQ